MKVLGITPVCPQPSQALRPLPSLREPCICVRGSTCQEPGLSANCLDPGQAARCFRARAAQGAGPGTFPRLLALLWAWDETGAARPCTLDSRGHLNRDVDRCYEPGTTTSPHLGPDPQLWEAEVRALPEGRASKAHSVLEKGSPSGSSAGVARLLLTAHASPSQDRGY